MGKQHKPGSPFDALRIARLGRPAPLPQTTAPAQTDGETATLLDSDTARQLNSRLRPSKSTDPEFMKFTTYVRKTTHRAVKTRLVSEGRELSDLVEHLMSRWLEGSL